MTAFDPSGAGFYLLNPVCLTFLDGHTLFGVLQDIQPEAFTVDGARYPVQEIQDLEFAGSVTDYHTYRGGGEIGRYAFSLEDLVPSFDRDCLIYSEFDCKVLCHLALVDGVIRAKDVHLLEAQHRLDLEVLSQGDYLYTFRDGSCRVGCLAGSGPLFSLSGAPLDPAQIAGITRAPQVNDQVTVSQKDGRELSGIVSAASPSAFVVLDQGQLPAMVAYDSIQTLRFRGAIAKDTSPKGGARTKVVVNGAAFLCKPPYCRSSRDWSLLEEGAVVTFAAGVNERGLIAKDVVVEAGAAAPSGEEAALFHGKGVILCCNTNASRGSLTGYIGSTYLSKAYSLYARCPMPRGSVAFSLAQLDFTYERENIYVVSYTCAADPRTGVQKALSVTLEETYPYAACARLRVDSDGKVSILPAATAYLGHLKSMEVEVTCKDGRAAQGILESCDGQWIELLSREQTTTLPVGHIASVRAYGYVTRYSQDSGTGHIGSFWFHVNDLRSSTDIARMALGSRVSFTVIQTFKGSCYAAADIVVHVETPVQGELTGYDGLNCTVIPQGQETAETYPAAMGSGLASRLHTLDFDQVSYPIVYLLRKEGLDTQIVITHIDTSRARRFGYIVKYIVRPESVSFGFIIPVEQLDAYLRGENQQGEYYFRAADLGEETGVLLNTRSNYYYVSFVSAAGKTAREIRVLEERPWPDSSSKLQQPAPAAPAAPAVPAAPVPAPKAAPAAGAKVETISLPELPPSSPYPPDQVRYGLLNLCSAHYAAINNCYLNKKYADPAGLEERTTVIFDPAEAQLLPEGPVKTAKTSYLVRFVPKGTAINPKTGEELPTIDYAYPVQVLQSFQKPLYVSLRLEQDRLLAEEVRAEGMPSVPGPKVSIPPLQRGESVFFVLAGKSPAFYTYQGQTALDYIVNDGESVPRSEVEKIYRFGVVTAFNLTAGLGTLNNFIRFSLTTADNKLINVLKNQVNVVRLHVLYAHDAARITEVCRIADENLRLMPWSPALVTRCESADRCIVADGSTYHYLSVLSDGMVNRSFKNDQLLDQAVFLRRADQLFLREGETTPALMEVAVDIRCRKETATVQYDAGRDIFLGYRNPTYFYPLYGAPAALQPQIGASVTVEFRVSADLLRLEGWLDNGEAEEPESPALDSEADAALENITRESLAILCLHQTDLSQLLLKGVMLDEQGVPADLEQAQRAFEILHGQPGDVSSLAAAKIALGFPELELSRSPNPNSRENQIGRLLVSAFQKRCQRIGLDGNSVFGEHSYYLTLLLRYAVKYGKRHSYNQSPTYDYLYRLFLQDFGTREELAAYLQTGRSADRKQLAALLQRPCRQIEEFTAHIMPLDKKSAEQVCAILEGCPALSEQVQQYAVQTDNTIRGKRVTDIVLALRERYIRDKARFADLFAEFAGQERLCADCKGILLNMQARFLKIVCKDDANRFERLLRSCLQVCEYTNKLGFVQQEQELKTAYREVCELEADILNHPCRESVEILVVSPAFPPEDSVLARIKGEIAALLNQLYQNKDLSPRIACIPNEAVIAEGQEKLWLIIQNGDKTMNLQPADNVTLFLESYTEDVSVPSQVALRQLHLGSGDQVAVEVALVVDNWKPRTINLGWAISFEYAAGFVDGHVSKRRCRQEQDTPLELQIGQVSTFTKDLQAENPYREPAQGQPLEGSEMFYGREVERREIWDSIVRTVDGREELIPGSAVIVHGQKKSGKTSLVNQIKNALKTSPDLQRQAILLNFNNILDEVGGKELLPYFKFTFYGNILSRFENEVYNNHPDVMAMMEENGLQIPDMVANQAAAAYLFDKFFRDFYRCDKGRHVIVLFMDEFTLLCTTILQEIKRSPDDASLATIPNFIKTFSSQYHFVQLVIGHEAMMRAFDTLGVLNHTAEFAKSVEISALDRDASQRLIKEPMARAFGEDVYKTELGRRAVEKLLDLSGCNPTYLMRLCNQQFQYYVDPVKCPRSQLIVNDVDAMTREFINKLLLQDFDILLVEDGDEAEDPEKRKTYQYLKCVSTLSAQSYDGRTADSSQVARELERCSGYDASTIERIRNLLEARRVISVTHGGRIKINAGLFSEFILQKNGGR